MKFEVKRSSAFVSPCDNAIEEKHYDDKGEYTHSTFYLEINTLEDLFALIDEVNDPIILEKHTIEIYDYYRE